MQSEHFTGHPVKDLVEIIFDCYGILTNILDNYNPTGDDYQDECVVALSSLFVHWPAEKLDVLKASMDHYVPEVQSNAHHLETSHEHARESEGARGGARPSIVQSMSKVMSGISFGGKSSSDSTHPTKSSRSSKSRKSRPGHRTSDSEKAEGGNSPGHHSGDPSISHKSRQKGKSKSPSNSPPRTENSAASTPPSTSTAATPVSVVETSAAGTTTSERNESVATNAVEAAEGRYSPPLPPSSADLGANASLKDMSAKNQEYFRKMREVGCMRSKTGYRYSSLFVVGRRIGEEN